MNNVYDDPAYATIREELEAAMWREQARLGDAPTPRSRFRPGARTSRPTPDPSFPATGGSDFRA